MYTYIKVCVTCNNIERRENSMSFLELKIRILERQIISMETKKAQIRLMDLRQKCISYMEIYELDCEIQKKKLLLEKLKKLLLEKAY